MNDPNHQDNFASIKNIIDRERDEALAFFRKKDFELRMQRRWEGDFKAESSFLFFLRKPVLILSALILICGAAAVITYQILSPSPYEKSVKVIEEFLLKNTNLSQVLAEEIIPGKERETITLSLGEELECWQSPKCRKKFFSQIIDVFKEV